MKHFIVIGTEIGRVGISEENSAITEVFFLPKNFENYQETRDVTPLLKKATQELQEYFLGQRKKFTIPLKAKGTDFQKKVWQALATIPYGITRSYGEIACQIGNPKAARAVGMANNKNPIGIIIPCHRVIGSNGSLVGYAGGLDKKKFLIELEKSVITSNILDYC